MGRLDTRRFVVASAVLTGCATSPNPPTASSAPRCHPCGTDVVVVQGTRARSRRPAVTVIAAADPRFGQAVRVQRVLEGTLAEHTLDLRVHSRSRFDARWPTGPRTLELTWNSTACTYVLTGIETTAGP